MVLSVCRNVRKRAACVAYSSYIIVCLFVVCLLVVCSEQEDQVSC